MAVDLLAYALEPYVRDGCARAAAWAVIFASAGLLVGFIYLIINGG